MFTGIVEGKGIITSFEKNEDIVRIEVKHSLDKNDIKVNDSICCSGICLTVVKQSTSHFQVEMVPETIKRSTANNWRVDTIINLERAMLATTRMGGHYLQGHVDTVVQIKNIMHFESSAIFEYVYSNIKCVEYSKFSQGWEKLYGRNSIWITESTISFAKDRSDLDSHLLNHFEALANKNKPNTRQQMLDLYQKGKHTDFKRLIMD